MFARGTIAVLVIVATACTSAGSPSAGAPASTQTPTATEKASPQPSLSSFGFPPVRVSPDHGAVGSRIRLEGAGFSDPEWRAVARSHGNNGYGVFLIRELPDGCELIAGARFTLRIDASGHLTSVMTVPDTGQCFQSNRVEAVTPGPYTIGIGCHACEVATFEVGAQTASFDACVGSPHGICTDKALYLAGDRPHIVATIDPASPNSQAILLRRAPGEPWEQVTSVRIDATGHMGWQWITGDQDVLSAGAWRFRYRMPGRGESDVVRVAVAAPDF